MRFLSLLLLVLVTTGSGYVAPLPKQPLCQFEAQVLSVNRQSVIEREYNPKVLTSFNMKIRITVPPSMVEPGEDKSMSCNDYELNKEIAVSAIQERDFKNPDLEIKEGNFIKGHIQMVGKKRYELDQVELGGDSPGVKPSN